MKKYQGPALYAFNNATFSEKDWAGVTAIGQSHKTTDHERFPIGRFGIGFNSVYHITGKWQWLRDLSDEMSVQLVLMMAEYCTVIMKCCCLRR